MVVLISVVDVEWDDEPRLLVGVVGRERFLELVVLGWTSYSTPVLVVDTVAGMLPAAECAHGVADAPAFGGRRGVGRVWLGRVEFDAVDDSIVENLVVVEMVERRVDDGQMAGLGSLSLLPEAVEERLCVVCLGSHRTAVGCARWE